MTHQWGEETERLARLEWWLREYGHPPDRDSLLQIRWYQRGVDANRRWRIGDPPQG